MESVKKLEEGGNAQDSTTVQLGPIPPPQPSRTILPGPLAQAISLTTRSTCLAIRAGTLVGSFGFDAAKVASLSGLELGRGVLSGILSRAGSNVLSRSKDDLSREETESLLEASLATLHHAMTHAVFWTATGFEMTSNTVSLVSGVSQLLLSALDQLFGSTDSSRAIASIITLIRREFQNPATGAEGEKVGVMDLISGLCAFAFLQHACRKSLDEENRRLGHEEIIWDVVVLDDGERVDIYGQSFPTRSCPTRPSSRASERSDVTVTRSLILQPLDQIESPQDSDHEEPPEICLKKQIMRSLPEETTVSISTTISTTKTITVDVSGLGNPQLAPPPGLKVVEEGTLEMPSSATSGHGCLELDPSSGAPPHTYRVVYRLDRNKIKSTTLNRCRGEAASPTRKGKVEEIDKLQSEEGGSKIHTLSTIVPDESYFSRNADIPPPVPPKPYGGRRHSQDELLREIPCELSMTLSDRNSGSLGSAALRPSRLPTQTRKPRHVNEANQKRQRLPLAQSVRSPELKLSRQPPAVPVKSMSKRGRNDESFPGKHSTKKSGGFRQALKIGSGQSLSNLFNKEPEVLATKAKAKPSPTTMTPTVPSSALANIPVPMRRSSAPGTAAATAKATAIRRISPDLGVGVARSPSRSSYISVHEQTRDSIVSQTDTYSIHSTDELRPASPIMLRNEVASSIVKSRSDKDIHEHGGLPPPKSHRRVKSQQQLKPQTPSLYSIATNNSQTSLVLYYQKSAYSNSDALSRLRRTGMVEGTFPRFHILRNITRYAKFSSASYGSNFLKYMGISKDMPFLHALDGTHHDVKSFAHHTESHANSILLASFVDPQGGSDSTGSTNTGFPLVHYISIDHESKAVVLACRGTLGFEDVLADMTCDYDDLMWRGKSYKVHKGIHASARRLLYGGDGRVLLTLKTTLDEHEDYGLVLCGHSLGGAVTALLGVMLSEPDISGTNFITTSEPHNCRLLTDGGTADKAYTHTCLPPARPIHVYAYGPPGTVSSSLRKATRGLITTVVQGNDLVPYLSLGVLNDFQAVALAFKNDSGSAKSDIYRRLWQAFQVGVADRWYANGQRAFSPTFSSTSERDNLSEWSHSAFKTLRTAMVYEKLLPPGEVFRVESTRVLRRDAFVGGEEDHLGRPARRVVLRYVRDVEARFREARFGKSMLMDHSPGRYEDALERLRTGVSEPGMG